MTPSRTLAVIAVGLVALGGGRLRRGTHLQPLVAAYAIAREATLQRERPFPTFNERDAPWVAGHEGDGTAHVVVGPMRVDVRERHDNVAGDRPAVRLLTAVQVSDGWVFVDDNGMVTRADTFTGPLHPIGTVPSDCSASMVTRGRMVARDGLGRTWTTDGHGPPTELHLPSVAMSVAFVTADRGAAVIDGGSVVVTHDGGATWTPVDLGGEAAWSVIAGASGVRVETTDGWMSVGVDGSLARCPDQTPWRVERPSHRNDLLAATHVHARVLPWIQGDSLVRRSVPRGRGLPIDLHETVGAHRRDPYPHTGIRMTPLGGTSVSDTAFGSLSPTSLSLAWRGTDLRGEYQGRVNHIPLAPWTADRQAEPPGSEQPVLVAVTRSGVLVGERAGANTGLWVSPEGTVHRVPAVWGRPWSWLSDLKSVPTEDGGVVLAGSIHVDRWGGDPTEVPSTTWAYLPRERPTLLAMETRGFDGTVRGRRAYMRADDVGDWGLAGVHGVWGLLVPDVWERCRQSFYPVGGGASVAIASSCDVRPCVRAPRSDATLIVVDAAFTSQRQPYVDAMGDFLPGAIATLDVAPDGMCLRSVAYHPNDTFVRWTPTGVLTGTMDDGDDVAPVRATAIAHDW